MLEKSEPDKEYKSVTQKYRPNTATTYINGQFTNTMLYRQEKKGSTKYYNQIQPQRYRSRNS